MSCCPGNCLSEGDRQETVGCVQWSAAVVCLCPGSHGLSRGKDMDVTTFSFLLVKYGFCGCQEVYLRLILL